MRKSVVLWLVSMIVVAAISVGLTAQVQVQRTPSQPQVLSGADIGFRVDGQQQVQRIDPATGRRFYADTVTGQLVVKINGQWVEAQAKSGGVRPLTN